MSGRARISGPHESETIRGTFLGKLPPAGHCTDIRLKHTPRPPVKKAWSLSLRGRLQVHHTSRGFGCAFREAGWGTPSLCSPLTSLWLTGTSQKGAHTLFWSPDFCNCHQGVTSRLPGQEACRAYDWGPTGLYTFACFKSCCLRV